MSGGLPGDTKKEPRSIYFVECSTDQSNERNSPANATTVRKADRTSAIVFIDTTRSSNNTSVNHIGVLVCHEDDVFSGTLFTLKQDGEVDHQPASILKGCSQIWTLVEAKAYTLLSDERIQTLASLASPVGDYEYLSAQPSFLTFRTRFVNHIRQARSPRDVFTDLDALPPSLGNTILSRRCREWEAWKTSLPPRFESPRRRLTVMFDIVTPLSIVLLTVCLILDVLRSNVSWGTAMLVYIIASLWWSGDATRPFWEGRFRSPGWNQRENDGGGDDGRGLEAESKEKRDIDLALARIIARVNDSPSEELEYRTFAREARGWLEFVPDEGSG